MNPVPQNDNDSVVEEPLHSQDSTLRPLSQDRIIRGTSVAIVIAAILLLTPIFGAQWRAFFGEHIISFPFIAVLLLAIRVRLRNVHQGRERRFWNILTIGFVAWLLGLLTNSIFTVLFSDPMLNAFANNFPYLVFFGATAVALEMRPHVEPNVLTYRFQFLDTIGSFAMVFGLLVYFLLLPSLVREDPAAYYTSSYALFVGLDAYIIVRLWYLRGVAQTPKWRSIYTWLLLGAVIWGSGDLCWVLEMEGILVDPGYGSYLDLIWPMAFLAVVVATRVTTAPDRPPQDVQSMHQPLGMGLLVVYSILPLALHVLLYRIGSLDIQSQGSREILVLGFTVLLAVMAMTYQRLLRIENRRLTREEALIRTELVHLAFHDELTGLPNRNMFRDRLQQAIADYTRYGHKFAVLFFDLDQFKVINDSLGHEAGDQVLVTSARRLKSSLRQVDIVARLGGDEFAIIVQRIERAQDVGFLAGKLLAAIREPLLIGNIKHVVTASIGVALFPDDGKDEETLLKHADTAMYQAKLHGRNTFKLFTDAMNEAARERLAIEQGLRTGLMADQFSVFYQPIVELASGKTRAFEALLRWNHPERGYISPVSFIDVAEQTGQIVPIGKWVLEKACTWAAQLQLSEGAEFSIAVNMSARQFRDPELVQDVRRILASTGLDPSRLHLEITETLALSIDSTVAALKELRETGVKIAIDDFGTGYAALSLLRDLPVDIVKIDESFIRGIESDSVNEAIVLAIVNMAKVLGIYVIAEGVETEAELNVIRQSQCDAVQGFYFSKPLPQEQLEEKFTQRDGDVGIPSEQDEPTLQD